MEITSTAYTGSRGSTFNTLANEFVGFFVQQSLSLSQMRLIMSSQGSPKQSHESMVTGCDWWSLKLVESSDLKILKSQIDSNRYCSVIVQPCMDSWLAFSQQGAFHPCKRKHQCLGVFMARASRHSAQNWNDCKRKLAHFKPATVMLELFVCHRLFHTGTNFDRSFCSWRIWNRMAEST